MNRCKNCALRIKSKHFRPDLYRKIPIHLRHVFICNEEPQTDTKILNQYICPVDLWVLTFIQSGDRFAEENACTTLDHLVERGEAELLCNLFENSPYGIRRELWLRMTTQHRNRLHLFDAVFEKNCLAPYDSQNSETGLHYYQNCMLCSNFYANPIMDEL